MYAVCDAVAALRYDIALGRVQVTARWVAAQRPARTTVLLPGRESERKFKQRGDVGSRKRLRSNAMGPIEIDITHLRRFAEQRQSHLCAAAEGAERFWLRCPVEAARAGGISLEMVFSTLVVVENDLERVIHFGGTVAIVYGSINARLSKDRL